MSMDSHGRSRLNCVCRCSIGLVILVRPLIHIFDGEKVCIHSTRPAQRASLPAAARSELISSGVVTMGLHTTLMGSFFVAFSPATSCWALAATCLRAAGP